jgi:hypothetical protein
MPVCFGIVKSIPRFFRRPPSGKQPGDCRKVSRPPEVSVPPEKQRLLASKFGFGRLRRAQLLTRFKSSMGASGKPGEKNCKWMKRWQIEAEDFCQRDFEREESIAFRLPFVGAPPAETACLLC